MIDLKHTAFLFPGQGSQRVGMGLELAQAFPEAMNIYTHADEKLGYSISSLSWNGPDTSLNDTINTQPALFTHSIAALKVFQAQTSDARPLAYAGHSMGEISALTAVDSLSFLEGLQLCYTRGKLMKQAGENSPGGMAAIIGLTIPELDRICADASSSAEIIQVANDNCPGQVVISGANQALERAVPLLQGVGARRIIRLAVSIAAHSPLMAQAQLEFGKAVDDLSIHNPTNLIIGNVSAQALKDAQAIRQDLKGQLTNRVRWTETIQHLKSIGVTNYIEIGNGSVLGGLVARIDPSATTYSMGTPRELETILKNL